MLHNVIVSMLVSFNSYFPLLFALRERTAHGLPGSPKMR